jgi:hypothetical protein
MNERPILFSSAMVRALLAGTKTQTRREVKATHPADATSAGVFFAPGKEYDGEWNWLNGDPRDCDSWSWVGEPFRCPYGAPSDRLWVRETWGRFNGCGTLAYRATNDENPMGSPERWRPSIHMPRKLSRIDLEVTGLRVQQLHDISEADAIAEGLIPLSEGSDRTWTADGTARTEYETAREAYAALWDDINGFGSWDANPWVWVVDFKVVR